MLVVGFGALVLMSAAIVATGKKAGFDTVKPLQYAAAGGLLVGTILAGLTAFFPKEKYLYYLGFASWIVLSASFVVASLVFPPYNYYPYAACVIAAILALLSGVYGWPLLAICAIAVVGFAAYSIAILLGAPGVSMFEVGMIMVSVVVPLVASALLWRRAKLSVTESNVDTSFNALAAQLNQVASKSEIVINAIGDGVIAVDSHGVVQLINPAGQQALGWDKADSIGLDFRSVLQIQTLQGTIIPDTDNPVIQTLQNNSKVQRSDVQVLTKSGKVFQSNIQASPVGQIGSGAIIVFRDITADKAEEREQAEFVSTASHEMRTPVAAIEGYLGLALNPATAAIDDKARSYLGKAHESAQHLGRLFQDLLDVSKADDGRMRNEPRVIDATAIAGAITEGLLQKAHDKNLVLFFKPQAAPGIGERKMQPAYYVNADKDHLQEVLSNLVENAVKYTKQGDVSVDVTGDDRTVQFVIQDTGIGIPPEDMPHLFQKFYRVDSSDTREIGGTGLGLYLSRRLVEIMGGKIWVESELQKGSRFIVSLPRLTHDEATLKLQQQQVTAQQPVITA